MTPERKSLDKTEAKKSAAAKLRRMTGGRFNFNEHTPVRVYTKPQLMAMGITDATAPNFKKAITEYNKYI
jgi:hypothetical protein